MLTQRGTVNQVAIPRSFVFAVSPQKRANFRYSMFIDILVAEIGSTTTLVNAFNGIETDTPRFIGQGQAPTSVLAGDVRIGLTEAVKCSQRPVLRADCACAYTDLFMI